MKDSTSWLTPKQAANLAGYTGRHITNLITRGKLSATRDDGRYFIEKSEFFRIFPEALKKEQEGSERNLYAENSKLELENRMLKDIGSHKDKEIEFLRAQIEIYHREKDKMLDSLKSHARLLEHKHYSDTPDPNENKGWSNIFKRRK